MSNTTLWSGLVVFLIGLSYVFFTPPFQAPDETSHFLKAWLVSQGHLYLHPTVDHRLGDTLPASLLALCEQYRPSADPGSGRHDWADIRLGFQIPLDDHERIFIDFANTASYAPVAYLPAAGMIRLTSLLGAPPLVSLYVARVIHLGIWLFCLLFIWQRSGSSRWLFLYLGLLPGVLVFQSCLNPDVLVHAASWILIHMLWTNRSRMRWRIAGPLLLLISVQKLILFPLAWVNPIRQGLRHIYIWTLLAMIGAGIWGLAASTTFIPYDGYHPDYRESQTLNPGVDPEAQWSYICHHPTEYLHVLMTSLIRSAPATMAHILGKYGWEKHYLPPVILALLFLGGLLICAQTPGPKSLSSRLQLVAICGIVTGLFAISNYLLWEPVGALVQDNFQGRYFIPILPLAGFALSKTLLSGDSLRFWAFFMLLVGHLSMIALLVKSLFF